MRRGGQASAVWVAFLALWLQAGCRGRKPVGQLVISIQTDLAIPEQIDTVRVQVLIHGNRQLDNDYPVGTDGKNRIPATITLVVGKDPSVPVTIRVAAAKGTQWRTFRESVTTVPEDRKAHLPMSIQWLCDGMAKVEVERDAAGDKQNVKSTCADGNSCVAGKCVPTQVPISSLSNFEPGNVFGGAEDPLQGTCFDTVACMTAGQMVQPSEADCTIPRPRGGAGTNVALRVTGDGICDPAGNNCFVPLDASSPEGWTVAPAGDRLALPGAVCDKLKQGAVTAVYVSTGCASKTAAIPPCGDWSSVRGNAATPTGIDAGPPPTATKIAEPGGPGAGVPCCPLMSDGTHLYTCLCPTLQSTRLIRIDGVTREVTTLFPLPVPDSRTSPYFAAALRDDTVFWVDAVANTIHRISLRAGGPQFPPIVIKGEIAEATPLLADGSAMYLLALAVTGAQGSPVQLVKVHRASGEVRTFDTGANFHVRQFAQDDLSIYVASDLDTEPDAGASVQRQSRLVRIAKADGATSEVSEVKSLTTSDRLHGGFISVHTDRAGGAGLYALYEDGPANGAIATRVLKVEPSTRTSTSLLDRSLDPGSTTLWLLGVVDGAVLLAKTEDDTADGGVHSVRKSTVLALPARGGPPRIVADFVQDHPLLGLNALAQDATFLYWLNSGGDLMRLPLEALK